MEVVSNREEWKDIKETNNQYQISNFGRIKSKARTIIYKNGKVINKKEKIMKPFDDKDGYKNIFIHPMKKHFKIHRLVAEYFLLNENNYPLVNHKDKNPSNNKVDNLEWCTYNYNNTYAGARDTQKKRILQFDLDGNLIKEWESISLAAQSVDTSAGNITECCKGNHKHIKNYIWKFKGDVVNESNI